MLIATETGVWVSPEGEELFFRAGSTRVWENHPMAKAMPQNFAPITVTYDVEQMTASPGELRGEETEDRVLA
jgi:hypothetical protein